MNYTHTVFTNSICPDPNRPPWPMGPFPHLLLFHFQISQQFLQCYTYEQQYIYIIHTYIYIYEREIKQQFNINYMSLCLGFSTRPDIRIFGDNNTPAGMGTARLWRLRRWWQHHVFCRSKNPNAKRQNCSIHIQCRGVSLEFRKALWFWPVLKIVSQGKDRGSTQGPCLGRHNTAKS